MASRTPRLARTVVRLARIIEHACTELSFSAYRVLLVIDEGEERASRIAKRLGLAEPTISNMVDGLVDQELLERVPDQEDRRVVRLRVTPKGRKVIRRTEASIEERLGPIFEHVDDLDRVFDAVDAVRQAMGEVAAERARARRTRVRR